MLNRVILMGRLTAEPDYRTTQSGVTMVRFTLAVERDYSQQGERQTDFIDIIAWRNTADFVSRYFHKGQLVALQGTLQVRSYTDRDGNKRRAWEVVADQVYFAEPKRDNGYQGNNYDYSRYDQMTPPPAPAAQQPSYSEPASSYQSGDSGDFTPVADDDLPF